jgi:hypothetical protein
MQTMIRRAVLMLVAAVMFHKGGDVDLAIYYTIRLGEAFEGIGWY